MLLVSYDITETDCRNTLCFSVSRLFVVVPLVAVLFSILLSVLICLAIFIADLIDPFQGNYRVGRSRMARTLNLLDDMTKNCKGGAGAAARNRERFRK